MIGNENYEWLREILICPDCGGRFESNVLIISENVLLICDQCGSRFGPYSDHKVLDLRCSGTKKHMLILQTGDVDFDAVFRAVRKGPPQLSYDGPLPPRTYRGFLSIIKDHVTGNGFVLDLGCGHAPYRPLVRDMGVRYVATDYSNEKADILADAHALPFESNCADIVLMHAVSQALENPFIAFGEIMRVLKEDGVLLGTADCAAVFASSFFHMTPWGVISVLSSHGMHLERMWINKDALLFLGTNPGYPVMIKFVLRLLSKIAKLSFLSPRRLLKGKAVDDFITAGSFAFVARKPRNSAVEDGVPGTNVSHTVLREESRK